MFVDLSWSHILLLLVVALIVVGPKDLPRLMREVGRWAGKARAMADQFRKSFDEMARQSELDELRREIDELRAIRPIADVQRHVSEAILPPDLMSQPPMADDAPPAPEPEQESAPEPESASQGEKTPAP
jgi:sec-independent protein translocase protein TatB